MTGASWNIPGSNKLPDSPMRSIRDRAIALQKF